MTAERRYVQQSTGERICRDCAAERRRRTRARSRQLPDWHERKQQRNARDRAKRAVGRGWPCPQS